MQCINYNLEQNISNPYLSNLRIFDAIGWTERIFSIVPDNLAMN